MKKVGPWTYTENKCGVYRALAGMDGENIENRVAFIEKTPRVRIRFGTCNGQWQDFLNWASADFKGDGVEDKESREWCDKMLLALGYELS